MGSKAIHSGKAVDAKAKLLLKDYGWDAGIPDDGQQLKSMKFIKLIIAADGVSPAEAEALRTHMTRYGVSEKVQMEVEAFDTQGAKLADIFEDASFLTPARAERLLCAAIDVAAADGFSDAERTRLYQAAEILGVKKSKAQAFEALFDLEQAARKMRVALFADVPA